MEGSEPPGASEGREELVLVYSTASISDGHLARGRLEAEGIPVLSKGMDEGPYRMGPVFLYVPASLRSAAHEILRHVLDEVPAEGSAEDGPAPGEG